MDSSTGDSPEARRSGLQDYARVGQPSFPPGQGATRLFRFASDDQARNPPPEPGLAGSDPSAALAESSQPLISCSSSPREQKIEAVYPLR